MYWEFGLSIFVQFGSSIILLCVFQGSIQYRITGYYPSSANIFSINPSTGAISLTRPVPNDLADAGLLFVSMSCDMW